MLSAISIQPSKRRRYFSFSFVLLALAFILPGVAFGQVTEYKIVTRTGNNGSDKPIYIFMAGTRGEMKKAFKLDAPGDDFVRNATDEFTYRSDRDLGIITDIAFTANKEDYWKVDRVEITRIAGPGEAGTTPFKSVWTTFNDLITGDQSEFKWPDNVQMPRTRIAGTRDTIVYSMVLVADNTQDRTGEQRCVTSPFSHTFATGVTIDKSNSTELTNSLEVAVEIGIPKLGASVSTAYSLSVTNSWSSAFGQFESNDKNITWDTPICADPGTIRLVKFDVIEKRKLGTTTFLNGSQGVYQVLQSSFGNTKWYSRNYIEIESYLNGTRPDPELDELLRLAGNTRLTPRNPSYAPIDFGQGTTAIDNPPVDDTPTINDDPYADDVNTAADNPSLSAGTGYVCIQNNWHQDRYIHNENGGAEVGQIQEGWWSAQWKIIPVPGDRVQIQNRWQTDQYLHIQNGSLEVGPIQSNWNSAQWKLVPAHSGWVRIQNAQNPNAYINNEDGYLAAGPIQPNWASAIWKVE